MNVKLLFLISASLLLAGCTKSSSIDARKTGSVPHRLEISTMPELSDEDVFGNELTLDISEEDIQNAVEEASGEFDIPLHSSVVLVQSGARAPDSIMQNEMQKYFRVSTFSGIPASRKKLTTQPSTPVKDIVESDEGELSESKNGVINSNYMQAMRYIAAKGRQKTIVVYWGELEAGKFNSETNSVSWKRYSGEKLIDSSLRYLIRFALVNVATGEWAVYSPVNTESATLLSSGNKGESTEVYEQQIAILKQKACQMAASDLVSRYSNKI